MRKQNIANIYFRWGYRTDGSSLCTFRTLRNECHCIAMDSHFFARFRLIYQIRRRKSFLYLNLFWFVLLPRFFFSIIFMQIELIHDAIHVFICKLNVLIIPCAQILWPSFMLHECVHLMERVSSPMTAIEWSTPFKMCLPFSFHRHFVSSNQMAEKKSSEAELKLCWRFERKKACVDWNHLANGTKRSKYGARFFSCVSHKKWADSWKTCSFRHSLNCDTETTEQHGGRKKMVVIIVHASKQILHEQTWVLVTAPRALFFSRCFAHPFYVGADVFILHRGCVCLPN